MPPLFTDLAMPRDANGRAVATVFGYDPATDVFYPLAVEDMGDGTFKLKVTAEFSGSISIGNVSIKSGNSADLATVTADKKVLAVADDDPMFKKNITTDYTYHASSPGLGKVATIKEYPSGSILGAPAKLSSYTYDVNDKISKVAVTDTTV
jgi:glucose/arabinose dehydrogenase